MPKFDQFPSAIDSSYKINFNGSNCLILSHKSDMESLIFTFIEIILINLKKMQTDNVRYIKSLYGSMGPR